MSETTEDEAPDGGKKGKKAKKDKGGKSNLVPALILAAGLLGGGYFMGPGSATGTAAAGPTTTEKVVLGEVATVEPININLADGHFLRVGVALQLVEGVVAADFMKGEQTRANDLLISQLGGSPMGAISTPEGREKVKKELVKQLKEIYEGDVTDVYFTDFVMQ